MSAHIHHLNNPMHPNKQPQAGKLFPAATHTRKHSNRTGKWLLAGILAALMLLAPAASQAAVYTWTSTTGGTTTTDGAGTWSTSVANWRLNNAGTAVVWPGNNDAIIGNGGTPGTITLAGNPVVGNLTFQSVASGYYILTSSTLRVGGAGNHGNLSDIYVPAGQAVDIGNGAGSGIMLAEGSAGSGVICDGGGTLILSFKGKSTYTGATSITNSTTVLVFTNAFVASSGVNLVSGTLATYTNANSISVTNTPPVNLKGNFTLGFANGAITSKPMLFSGAWTLSGGSWTVTNNAVTNTITGAIGDGGGALGLGVASLNSGALTLGYAGTEGYTGPTTISSGTLALGASCNLNAASGVAIAAGATFDVSAQPTWTAGSSASPAITASGTGTAATIKGGTTVAFGSRPITLNYDGVDDTMLTISSGALTMNGQTITINTNASGTGATLSLGAHNIIQVTGGSLTAGGTYIVNGNAIAAGNSATITTSGGTTNYVVLNVSGNTPPTVDNPTKSAYGGTTATLGATVESANSGTITDYGVVWNTTGNPTIADNVISAGSSPTLGSPFTVSATSLTPGSTIYYRGYATSSYGTGYSPVDSFVTLAAEPTTQASGVNFTAVQGGAMTVNWTRGNGASCIVLAKASSAVDANPADGATYTANSNLGSGSQIGTGNYVVYNGTGTSVTLLALTPGTTYNVAVYEYNGSGGTQNYLTASPATGSQTTAASSVHPVVYYSGAATGDPTSLTAWWTGNNGSGAHPADFTSGDTFIIQNGHNYTIPTLGTWTVNATTAGTAATVQINSTGVLTFNLASGQGGTLKLGGNLVQTAASAYVGLVGSATSVNGLVEFTSSGSWTGSGNISNVKLNVQVDSGAVLDATGITPSSGSGFILRSANSDGITVNNGGTLNVGTLTINGSSATGSAFFTLNSGGTLVTANNSASGIPGIFTGFNTGKINLNAGANYTFNGTSAQVTGTSANNATNPATITGTLTINNPAGVTLSQNTTNNGTLVMQSGPLSLGGNTLAYGATATLKYAGTSAQTTTDNEFPATSGPASLVISNAAGVTLHAARAIAGTLTLASGQLTSAGNLTIADGGGVAVTLGSGTADVSPAITGPDLSVTYNGTPAVTVGGDTTYGGTASVVPAGGNLGAGLFKVNTTGGATLDATVGTLTCGGGAVGSGSSLNVATGGTLKSGGTFATTGALSFTGTGKYQHNQPSSGSTIPTAAWASTATCEIIGTVTSGGTGFGQAFGNFVWNPASQSANYNFSDALTNVAGTLDVKQTGGLELRLQSGSGTSAISLGAINVEAGTLALTSGAATNAVTVTGNVTIAGGATLTMTEGTTNFPALNVGGALNNGGTLKMAANKTGGVVTASKLAKTAGILSYGGALVVTAAGDALAGGDTVYLFNAPGGYAGSFTSTNLPALASGLNWSTNNLVVDGSIAVFQSGPSGPGYITNSLSSSTLTLTWPAGQGWRLVGQTNGLSVGLTTNGWNTVPGGVDGSNSISVDPAQPAVFYKLVSP